MEFNWENQQFSCHENGCPIFQKIKKNELAWAGIHFLKEIYVYATIDLVFVKYFNIIQNSMRGICIFSNMWNNQLKQKVFQTRSLKNLLK